jgi:hypothetical protein
MINFVRSQVPAARHPTDRSILEAIDGYPGVLDFWTSEAHRMAMRLNRISGGKRVTHKRFAIWSLASS